MKNGIQNKIESGFLISLTTLGKIVPYKPESIASRSNMSS